MKWSQAFIPTMRDVPKDAEAASHKLALRAGLVRQLSSGVYSYLPTGVRVLHRVKKIIRQEMAKAGAAEVLLPSLHPAELWKKSGRFDALGEDKISFKNRAGHEFVLGPTHEEVVTDLVGSSVKSFRDLPVVVYQIQTKFRDEARPRFGVIRTKEFLMKDAYSFDADEKGLDGHYQKMSEAYTQIFSRCGLKFQVVSADPGLMGGKMSQEFMVICPYGEDRVAKSEKGYLASLDIAERKDPGHKPGKGKAGGPEAFDTPNLRTIEEMESRFKIPAAQMLKTLIYMADEKPVAAVITGDSELNESKLRRMAGARELRQANSKEVQSATNAPVGFAGPVGLKIPVYADWDAVAVIDGVTGANEKDKHLRNVNFEKDYKTAKTGDLRYVKEGDTAPDGGKFKLDTAMEVGHIFKLGIKYSESIGAHFTDEKGVSKPIIMGCYGIGVNRILAGAIEENHDDKGIIWPEEIAPYDVEIITVNQADEKIRETADGLYGRLTAMGLDVLYDDRDERAGVKFKDADLVGIPKQVVIGERNLKDGCVEIKCRKSGEQKKVAVGEVESILSLKPRMTGV